MDDIRCIKIPMLKGKKIAYNPKNARFLIVNEGQSLESQVNESICPEFFTIEKAQISEDIFQLNIANTRRCNLACSYCYDHLGEKGDNYLDTPLMSEETARKCIDELFRVSGEIEEVLIFLVGGEPLVHGSVVRFMVDYAEKLALLNEKLVVFTIYTNGVSLDKKWIDWANEHFVNLVLSMDGDEKTHDAYRKDLSGKGSHAQVLKATQLLMEDYLSPFKDVRAVVADSEADPITVLNYFVGLGFNKLHISPAYDTSTLGYRTHIEKWLKLCDHYFELLNNNLIISLEPFNSYLKKIIKGSEFISAFYPCNAGVNMIGIGPDGQMYPCHHFFGQPEFKLGHIDEGLLNHENRKALFREVDDRPACKKCWARRICGGECYHRATTVGSGFFGTQVSACEEKRILIEHTIQLTAVLRECAPDILQRVLNDDFSTVKECRDVYERDA